MAEKEEKASLTDAQRVDLLLRSAAYEYAKYTDRRTYEWKMAFGFWSVYIALAYFMANAKPETIGRIPGWAVYLLCLVALYIQWTWQAYIYRANGKDMKNAKDLMEKAYTILGANVHQGSLARPFLKHSSPRSIIFITVMLLLIVVATHSFMSVAS